MGYAGLAMGRRFRYLPVLVAVQVAVEWLVVKTSRPAENLAGPPLQRQLTILAFCAMMGIIAAYSLMIHFLKVEGRRYVQARTEIALAAEIHTALVPACNITIRGFEIYGASVPSGGVGGDLVDIVEQPEGWTAYVADVSGHGVPSGVLMAMFKTALRGQLLRGGSPAQLLDEVHRTLFPLKLGNMFVTVGILQSGNGGRVSFALAGHPPILHYHKRSGTASEYAALDMPLGIMERQEFSESTIQCEVGDVLLILTDGLTEVFNARGNEMGLEALKAGLLEHIGSPLHELFDRLRTVATTFGPQLDDQTLLLARYQG
ncbi:MAG TPA: PP2C family protein-serine/threonine phosphatase [Candidatus Acidoferrum sp.]|nr:PP2C family protein-serine/threonine phosphatase [Candidatus Acidoferrum sp.]